MQSEFAKFGETFVLYCHVTTDLLEDRWPDLLSEKGGTGWPHVAFLDAEGEMLLPHKGPDTVEGFAKSAADARTYLAARAAAAGGDRTAAAELALLGLEYGTLSVEDGEAKLKALGELSEEHARRRDRALARRKSEALCGEASAKLAKDDFDGAFGAYTRAIELDPASAAAYRGRAVARRRAGDLDAAVEDYDKAVALEPSNAAAHAMRGHVRYDAGARDAALADFRKACELDPTGQDYVRLNVWLVRAGRGERDDASRELRGFLDGRKTTSDEDWYTALARFLLGELPEAELLARTEAGGANAASGRRCDAHFYVGSLRLVEGDPAAAKAHFEKCVETGVKGYTEYWSARAELARLASTPE